MDGLEEPPCDLLDLLGDQDTDNSLDQLLLEWGSSKEEQCHLQGEVPINSDCLIELEELNQLPRPPRWLQPDAVTSSMGSCRGGAGAGGALYASHPPPHPGAAAAGTTDPSWDAELFPELMQPYGNNPPLASPCEAELQQQVLPIQQPVHQQQQQQPWVANNQQPSYLLGADDFDQQQLQLGGGDQQQPGHWNTPQLDVAWLPGPGPATSHGCVPLQDMQTACTAAAGGAAAPPVPPYAEAAAGGGGARPLLSAGGYQTAAAGLVTVPSDASTSTMVAGAFQRLGGKEGLPVICRGLDATWTAAAAGGGMAATAPPLQVPAAAGGAHYAAHADAQSAALQEEFNHLQVQLCTGAADAPLSMDLRTQAARFLVGLSAAADGAGLFATSGGHSPGRNVEHFEQLIAAGLLDSHSVGYWAYKDGCHPYLHPSGNPSAATSILDVATPADASNWTNPCLTSSSGGGSGGGSGNSSSGSCGGIGAGMGSAYAMVVSSTRCSRRGTTAAECNTRRHDFSRHANVAPPLDLAVRITGPGVPTAEDGSPAWFQLYSLYVREDIGTVRKEGGRWRHSATAPAVQVQDGTKGALPVPLTAHAVIQNADGSCIIRTSAGKQLQGLPKVLSWAAFHRGKPFCPKPSRQGDPKLWYQHTHLVVMRDGPYLKGAKAEEDMKRKAAAGSAAAGSSLNQPAQAAAAGAACARGAVASSSNPAAQEITSPLVCYKTGININTNTTMYSNSSQQQSFMELLLLEDSDDVAAQPGGAAFQPPQVESNQSSAHCARKRACKTTNMYHNQHSA